jgi:xanthine dehydrogenase YagR molybdenum-binding subunit
VEFIDEPDFKFNSAGVKGLGEVSVAGVAPAIANGITASGFRHPIRGGAPH